MFFKDAVGAFYPKSTAGVGAGTVWTAMPTPTPTPAGSGWDPTFLPINGVLANSKQTLRTTNPSNAGAAGFTRGVQARKTGKYRMEYRLDSFEGGVAIGIIDASYAYGPAGNPGTPSDARGGCGFYSAGFNVTSGHFNNAGPNWKAGDILDWDIDFSANNGQGAMYFTLNNVAIVGDPVAGTGGLMVSTNTYDRPVPFAQVSQGIDALTGRFTLASMQYAPPSGYLAWDGI